MKLAIMQPYIFPYVGYFQLINQADKFIVYDDVNYIKQGWINRNRILLNGTDHLFTVPLKNASSFKLIRETELDNLLFSKWKSKFYKTLEQAYKKAPYYTDGLQLISSTIETECSTISELAVRGIDVICEYMNITTELVNTSVDYKNDHLSGEERVIDLCLKERAGEYINPLGGQELYSKENFRKHGLELQFLKSGDIIYPQFKNQFVPWLSIIDVIMFNDKNAIEQILLKYSLS